MSRYALAIYTLIVIDASLYPFSGWRDLGLAPFGYLAADWPPRVLPFDMLANALGYAPLGFLAGLSLHPRVRPWLLVLGALAYCLLWSLGIEAAQTYLPARVASKADVACNAMGGLLGALAAGRFARPLLDTGRLRVWRARWFASDASRGLVLVIVWFAALIYPETLTLGTGGLLKAFDPAWAEVLASIFGLTGVADPDSIAVRFQWAEGVVSAAGMVGAGVLFVNLQRETARWTVRLLLLAGFVAITIGVKTFAHAFLFEEFDGLLTLAPGARLGMLAGSALLMLAWLLPMRVRWALGIAALVGAVVLVNVVPDNPYANPVPLAWTRGRLMNFFGLAKGLNLAWPYFALGYYLRHRQHRGRPSGRVTRQRGSDPPV